MNDQAHNELAKKVALPGTSMAPNPVSASADDDDRSPNDDGLVLPSTHADFQ